MLADVSTSTARATFRSLVSRTGSARAKIAAAAMAAFREMEARRVWFFHSQRSQAAGRMRSRRARG
jgi:hypothetical protein